MLNSYGLDLGTYCLGLGLEGPGLGLGLEGPGLGLGLEARYGQKLGQVQKWLHSDALQRAD